MKPNGIYQCGVNHPDVRAYYGEAIAAGHDCHDDASCGTQGNGLFSA
jgi:hypothetical protein